MARGIRRREFQGLVGGLIFAQSPWMRFAHGNWVDVPKQDFGVMSGEVGANSAVIWGRSNLASKMRVEWDTSLEFQQPRNVLGPVVDRLSDFTGRTVLRGLPQGETIYYRVFFENGAGASEPSSGSFRTGFGEKDSGGEDLFFAWSGDTAGQGFGINLEWGGMRTYASIAELEPQFFVHSGDMIYADNPILESMTLTDGTLWKNVVTQAKSHVASSLDDFRGNYLYNLLDTNVRAFHQKVPYVVQWDDHETTNNWYPQQSLARRKDGSRYDAMEYGAQLAGRAKQAFFEYMPLMPQASGERRIYRKIARGPLCDLFVLDFRSYRGPNTENQQEELDATSSIMGREQLEWLKKELQASRAVWKVLCCDMPLGIPVGDGMEGKGYSEAVANGKGGRPLGRELELQELLEWMKQAGVANTIWITADVHYAAAHFYDETKSAIPGKFESFWEFVAGPLHAGSFGPNSLDDTFGPEVKFQFAPPRGSKLPLAPSDGMQSFGTIRIDAKTKECIVELRGGDGKVLEGGQFVLEPRRI